MSIWREYSDLFFSQGMLNLTTLTLIHYPRKTWSPTVDQTDLKLTPGAHSHLECPVILLTQPPECLDHRQLTPACLACYTTLERTLQECWVPIS